MFQRKYHSISIDKKGNISFFEGFYRNSSIKYWQRYRDSYLKNNATSRFDIFVSKTDATLVDKVIILNPQNEQYIFISDATLKKEYPEFVRRCIWQKQSIKSIVGVMANIIHI